MPYTTDDLITGIKRRGAVPTSQATFLPADFLSSADKEIQTNLLPMILKARESYYSFDVTYAIDPNNGTYAIPSRAIGVKLQNIYITDGEGNRFQLNLCDESEVINLNYPLSGNPSFFLKGNNIILNPPNPSNYLDLVVTIFVRPNQLQQTALCAQVTGVSGGTLTFSSIPTNYTDSTVFDLIKGTPHYDLLAVDQTPIAVTTTTIEFSSLPADIAVGDWVSLAQTSPVVQIPTEFQGILEQRVANAYLRSQAFSKALEDGEKALKQMEDSFLLINPRSEKTKKKIVNRSGLIRRQSYWP